jgi:hypothetical protein
MTESYRNYFNTHTHTLTRLALTPLISKLHSGFTVADTLTRLLYMAVVIYGLTPDHSGSANLHSLTLTYTNSTLYTHARTHKTVVHTVKFDSSFKVSGISQVYTSSSGWYKFGVEIRS